MSEHVYIGCEVIVEHRHDTSCLVDGRQALLCSALDNDKNGLEHSLNYFEWMAPAVRHH